MEPLVIKNKSNEAYSTGVGFGLPLCCAPDIPQFADLKSRMPNWELENNSIPPPPFFSSTCLCWMERAQSEIVFLLGQNQRTGSETQQSPTSLIRFIRLKLYLNKPTQTKVCIGIYWPIYNQEEIKSIQELMFNLLAACCRYFLNHTEKANLSERMFSFTLAR